MYKWEVATLVTGYEVWDRMGASMGLFEDFDDATTIASWMNEHEVSEKTTDLLSIDVDGILNGLC